MSSTASLVRHCPHCGRGNRVPVVRLGDQGTCGACKQALPRSAEPLDVDEAQFDAILASSPLPVLVDFWAPWCGPCLSCAPEVKTAAEKLGGSALVLKVNTETHPALASRYAVRSIPNFAVFRGGKLVRQQAGAMGHRQLMQLLA